jgi:Zn-dependent protease with chaperone function
MTASQLALQVLAFALTYAIHSTLLLGLACLIAPRLRRSLALREHVWKFAMVGAILTSLAQVGARLETPLFHWSLEPELAAAPASAAEPSIEPAATDEVQAGRLWVAARVAEQLETSLATALQRAFPEPREFAVEGPETVRGPFDDASSDDASPRSLFTPAAVLDASPAPVAPPRWRIPWREWSERGMLAWSVFALAVLALFAFLWWRLSQRLRGRVELGEGELRETLDRLQPLAFPRGRRVRLFVAPELATPVSLGFLNPTICVPPRALTELSPDEQESMLAHELAHLMRRDPLWLSAAWLVERVFFFQPLNRIARSELHGVAELRCDDWAARRTGNRLALASCLARIAEWVVGAPRSLPATSMAGSHGTARLTQRIERLLEDDEAPLDERGPRWAPPAAAFALSSLVWVVPGVSADRARSQSNEPRESERIASTESVVADDASCYEIAPAVEAFGVSAASASEPTPAPEPETAGSAAAPSLDGEFDLLDESVSLLHEELSLLRADLGELLDEPELHAVLAALEQRAQRLERRRDQLRTLVHVLETLQSTPAHPPSTPSSVEVP